MHPVAFCKPHDERLTFNRLRRLDHACFVFVFSCRTQNPSVFHNCTLISRNRRTVFPGWCRCRRI